MNQDEIIFGIGLSKTGTTSLASALDILGFKSVHNWNLCVKSILKSDGPLISGKLLKFNAFLDQPWPMLYKRAAREYPNAKFILTTRDVKKYASSRLKHNLIFFRNGRKPKSRRNLHLLYMLEYMTHVENVHEFFEGSKNFFEFDLCRFPQWKELCQFLGREVPDVEFPCLNKRIEHEKNSDRL